MCSYIYTLQLHKCVTAHDPVKQDVQRAYEKWMAVPYSRDSCPTTMKTFSWIKVIHSMKKCILMTLNIDLVDILYTRSKFIDIS